MKNRLLKTLLLTVAFTFSFGLATGCGNVAEMVDQLNEKEVDEDEGKEEEEKKEKKEKEEETETEKNAVEETESEVEVAEEETEVTEEATEEAEDDSNATSLSGDWTGMEFVLDGKNFKLPFAYKDLEAEGWSFDLADYGYENGYVLNPGEKVYATIDLENPEYEDVTMYVGFKNTGDEIMDITECDVWSFELDTCYGFDQLEKYPDMMIGNGLKIGSTKSEVEALCGPCDDIYEATEHGYVVYSYDIDDYTLDMTIYEDKGITSFDLSTYE